MRKLLRFGISAAGWGLWLLAVPALAAEPCLVAFDLGSSGIRAGASGSHRVERAPLDALSLLGAETDFKSIGQPTEAILQALSAKFDTECRRLAGGFSVWRLLLEKSPGALAALLQRMEASTGIAVVVVPPEREGIYGYVAASQALGRRLGTSHVLDIGGGSLQIASATGAAGLPLGQKIWHRVFCEALRKDVSSCTAAALTGEQLARVRTIAAERLRPLLAELPPELTLTAVSRPVTRGIAGFIAGGSGQAQAAASPGDEGVRPPLTLTRAQITRAVDTLAFAPESSMPTASAGGQYLLSDMVLLEALLDGARLVSVDVADIDLSNVPGLLADARAYAWSRLYSCYLTLLSAQGLSAFDGNPGACTRER